MCDSLCVDNLFISCDTVNVKYMYVIVGKTIGGHSVSNMLCSLDSHGLCR